MQKFIKQIRNISEKIYDEIAGCEERYFQVALSIELNKKGINFLRETSVQFFYDKYPLSLFIFDFLIYPCLDLKKKLLLKLRLIQK